MKKNSWNYWRSPKRYKWITQEFIELKYLPPHVVFTTSKWWAKEKKVMAEFLLIIDANNANTKCLKMKIDIKNIEIGKVFCKCGRTKHKKRIRCINCQMDNYDIR